MKVGFSNFKYGNNDRLKLTFGYFAEVLIYMCYIQSIGEFLNVSVFGI
jgi:hypothetical protein